MKKTSRLFSLLLALPLLAVSCNKNIEEGYGYIQLELNTLESAIEAKAVMGAPVGYNPKQLYVEILDNNDNVVVSTSDFANDARFKEVIKLTPGKYTVNAHSYGWDGSDSGYDVPFYAGSATATVALKELRSVKLTCTLANVKVSVNYDNSFKTYFKSATTSVTSLIPGVAGRTFKMSDAAPSPAYFPVGDLALMLVVYNNGNISHAQLDTIRNVQPRQWVKINYTVAAPGTMGGVTVKVDDATRTYTFNLAVPRKPGISFECSRPAAADIWSRFVNVKGEITSKTAAFDAADGKHNVVLKWKSAASGQWNVVSNADLTLNGDTYSYKLAGLSPATKYQIKLCYEVEDPIESDVMEFTTASETSLYNGGFEMWSSSGKIQYPDETTTYGYWDTSNPGAANYIGSVATQDTGFKHSGNSSIRLATQWAVIKLAAGSVYTGAYNGLIGTSGAKLDWGVPFTSRPTSLHGYVHYEPGSINRGSQPSGVGAPGTGASDECQIFCVLLTKQLHVGGNASKDEYEKSTTLDWENDSRVIAYGELTKNNTTKTGEWEEFDIVLKYHDMNAIPTYMAIVASSSKYGDYFYGSDSSILWLDDMAFVYTDSPVKK